MGIATVYQYNDIIFVKSEFLKIGILKNGCFITDKLSIWDENCGSPIWINTEMLVKYEANKWCPHAVDSRL